MKTYELTQQAAGGGFPTPNEDGFSHGDVVLVVSKRELLSLLYRVTADDDATKLEISNILSSDKFVFRGDDLPRLKAYKASKYE